MSTLKSTGLANHMAVTGSMKAALDSGFIYIFSGPIPEGADDAVDGSSVLLAKVSVDGDGVTGLTFEGTASNGVLTKTESEAWKGPIVASGTATFLRHCESADDGTTASTTAKRLQDTVGTDISAGLVLTSTALVSGNTQNIDLYQVQQ